MRELATRTGRRLRNCWRTVLLLEVLFRLLSMFVVFPACNWLFRCALRATGLQYVSLDNLGRVLANPLMLLCFAAELAAFSLASMLESSCLITCLDAATPGDEADVLWILREGLRDAARLLQARNLPLLLTTILLIPATYLPSSASPLRLVNLPWRTLGQLLTRYPLILLPLGYFALVGLFTALAMCAYQCYALENLRAIPAIRRAILLNRGRRLRALGRFLAWTVCAAGGALALNYALGWALNRLIPLAVSNPNAQYRILLPLTILLNFLRSCTPVVACTSFLTVAYRARVEEPDLIRPRSSQVSTVAHRARVEEPGAPLPTPWRTPRRDARRRNALLLYAVLIPCALGAMVYDTHLRPLLVRMDALEYISGHPTLVVAHRGYFDDCDENTLSAFRAAIELGVDYVELDVQLTSDGEIIVNHDASYARVYGVNRHVWELSLDETRQLRGRRSGECPPTLREALTLCDPRANFLIELKDNGHDPEIAQAVYELLVELNCLDRCAVQSSSYRLIRAFKALAPEVRCGYILSFALGSYANLDAADFFSLDNNFANERVMNAVHSAGKDLYVWTINDESKISAAVELGADGVITDETPLAKTLLLERENAAPLDELIAAPIEDALQEAGEALTEMTATEQPATIDPASVDPATIDPASVDPATADP